MSSFYVIPYSYVDILCHYEYNNSLMEKNKLYKAAFLYLFYWSSTLELVSGPVSLDNGNNILTYGTVSESFENIFCKHAGFPAHIIHVENLRMVILMKRKIITALKYLPVLV